MHRTHRACVAQFALARKDSKCAESRACNECTWGSSIDDILHGFRTLSWGGARLDEGQLQERATRITGTHMDGLMDGLAQGQPDSQTSLQNAILVWPAPCCSMVMHQARKSIGLSRDVVWTECRLESHALLTNPAHVRVAAQLIP